MSVLFNRVRVNTATVGTGTMTLGAAVSAAFFTAAEAGIPDGTVVSYVIEDGSNVEMGIGTYTVSGTTLSRTTVTASKIGGTAGATKLTLSGSAVVFIDSLAADITVPPAAATDRSIATFNGTTGKAIQNNPNAILDSFGNLLLTQTVSGQTSLNITNTDTTTGEADFFLNSGTAATFQFRAVHQFGATLLQAITGNLSFICGASSTIRFAPAVSDTGVMDGVTGFFGWGTLSPSRKIHVALDDAANNTVTYVERLTHTTSGTPAVGIGVAMEFEVEVQAGVNKVGATIESYAYNVGAGTESFELVFKTMLAGAAATEEMRAGFAPVQQVQQDSIVMRANYGIVVPEYYEIASGVSLELGAGAIMEITG